MNPPQVYMCSPSRTLHPPPSPFHPSGSSQCTSPKYPVSCIEPGLATRFIHDILHVSMPFSQIFPPVILFHSSATIVILLENYDLVTSRFLNKTPALFFANQRTFFLSWHMRLSTEVVRSFFSRSSAVSPRCSQVYFLFISVHCSFISLDPCS